MELAIDTLPSSSWLPFPSSRLLQLGHQFMKQEVKRGNKFKNASNKTNLKLAVHFYNQAKVSNDPFARYYSSAAQLNLSFHNKNTMRDKGMSERKHLSKLFMKSSLCFITR